MLISLDDTIAALASPPGGGGRGIVRLSGPRTRNVLDPLFEPDDPDTWRAATEPRRHPGRLDLGERLPRLPLAVYLWPTRRSYTAQPLAELHAAGSPPLLERVLEVVFAAGARPARPGEFTLRAFLGGRLDLVQAEAVLGVIDAADHLELEQALTQLAGGLSGPLASLRGNLIDLLADLEAGLDFADEDIEFVSAEQLTGRLASAATTLAALIDQADARAVTRPRRRVVLAGLPNAGKSTLFNALARRRAALVSGESGTTRDYLVADIRLDGLPVTLVDTAGWSTGGDELDRSTRAAADEQSQAAELVLWCTAADLGADRRDAERQARAELEAAGWPVLAVTTRGDLAPGPDTAKALAVCAPRGDGLDALATAIRDRLDRPAAGDRRLIGSTLARCRDSLLATAAGIDRASAAVPAGDELVAGELREALNELGRILGTVYTDDVLDRVFERFCIGK